MYFICVYMRIHVYIGIYYLLQCALVHTYIYLHIHLVFKGDSLDCILYFEALIHYIVKNISLFYIHRSLCYVMKKIHSIGQYSVCKKPMTRAYLQLKHSRITLQSFERKKKKERKKTKIVFSILIKWGRRGRGGCSKNCVTWLGDTKFFARKEGGGGGVGGLQLFYYFTIQFNRIYIFRSSVF